GPRRTGDRRHHLPGRHRRQRQVPYRRTHPRSPPHRNRTRHPAGGHHHRRGALQVHGRTAPRRPTHHHRRLRTARFPQRPAGHPHPDEHRNGDRRRNSPGRPGRPRPGRSPHGPERHRQDPRTHPVPILRHLQHHRPPERPHRPRCPLTRPATPGDPESETHDQHLARHRPRRTIRP